MGFEERQEKGVEWKFLLWMSNIGTRIANTMFDSHSPKNVISSKGYV